MDLAASGQYDMVLPPQLIPWDTITASVSLTTTLQQQQPQFQMPYQSISQLCHGSS